MTKINLTNIYNKLERSSSNYKEKYSNLIRGGHEDKIDLLEDEILLDQQQILSGIDSIDNLVSFDRAGLHASNLEEFLGYFRFYTDNGFIGYKYITDWRMKQVEQSEEVLSSYPKRLSLH